MNEGVSLAELRDRVWTLPEFARWDQYETLHPQNANYTYLRPRNDCSSSAPPDWFVMRKCDGAGKPR